MRKKTVPLKAAEVKNPENLTLKMDIDDKRTKAAAGAGVEMYSAYAVQGPFESVRGYLIGNCLDRKVDRLVFIAGGSILFALSLFGFSLSLQIHVNQSFRAFQMKLPV